MSEETEFTVLVGVRFAAHENSDRSGICRRLLDGVMPVLRKMIRAEDSVFWQTPDRALTPPPAEPVLKPDGWLHKGDRGAHQHVIETHGNPADPKECGRPVDARENLSRDRYEPLTIHTCPVHGELEHISVGVSVALYNHVVTPVS